MIGIKSEYGIAETKEGGTEKRQESCTRSQEETHHRPSTEEGTHRVR